MALIYPYHTAFPNVNEPFYFSPSLRLWVLAFDLHNDKLQLPPACPLGEVFKARKIFSGTLSGMKYDG